MDTIFSEFGDAFAERNGYRLSQTLNPELSSDMLRVIFRSSNHDQVRGLLKRGIRSSSSSPMSRLSNEEVIGWVEVYYHYWKACGELLAIQEGRASNVRSINERHIYGTTV